jgi:hypothetical protein
MSKHGEELGKMNAELIKALQANRDKRRAEREERESIDSQLVTTLVSTSYYSECECGQVLEGEGEYDPNDGTLYGNDCESCGEEFTVLGWFDECDECEEYHAEGECDE